MMYVQDNKGQMFYVSTDAPVTAYLPGTQHYPLAIYMTAIGTLDFTDDPGFNGQPGALLPYLANGSTSVETRKAIFNCPSDTADGDVRVVNKSNQVGPRNFSYSFNGCLNWNFGSQNYMEPRFNNHMPAVRFTRIVSPADKILIFEEAYPNDPSCWLVNPGYNGGSLSSPGAVDGNEMPGTGTTAGPTTALPTGTSSTRRPPTCTGT